MSVEPGEAEVTVRREPRSMIDVTPRELPSSIAGQREALWRCSMIGVILGGRFAIFAVLRGLVALKRGVVTMSSPCRHLCRHLFFPYKSTTCGACGICDIKIEVSGSSFSHISHISHISL